MFEKVYIAEYYKNILHVPSKSLSSLKCFWLKFMTEYYVLKIFFTKWRKLGPPKKITEYEW
jgi:hypothetical protein